MTVISNLGSYDSNDSNLGSNATYQNNDDKTYWSTMKNFKAKSC